MKTWIVLLLAFPLSVFAKPVLADLSLLESIGVKAIFSDPYTGVAYADLKPDQEWRLSVMSHANGRCGGYEALDNIEISEIKASLQNMSVMKKNSEMAQILFRQPTYSEKSHIVKAISELKAQNLRTAVEWMTSYTQRYNKAQDPNVHVRAMVEKLNKQIKDAGRPDVSVETIDHLSTKQKSIRVTFPGTTRPQEILVLGAHFDSINHWNPAQAPGADDDGSGSANVLEVFRVLLTQAKTERTLELYWYAGEESGLLGSAEIAQAYKKQAKNVIGVMQLDMTLFPGGGFGNIGMVTDFTNAWLNGVVKGLNATYVKATIFDNVCGYGCSDHASWHRQGFAATTPFESLDDLMNKNLHTPRDVIDNNSDFEHSLIFSKLAMAFFLELGDSQVSQANP